MPDLTSEEFVAALLDPRPLFEQPVVQELMREIGRDVVPRPRLTLIQGGIPPLVESGGEDGA